MTLNEKVGGIAAIAGDDVEGAVAMIVVTGKQGWAWRVEYPATGDGGWRIVAVHEGKGIEHEVERIGFRAAVRAVAAQIVGEAEDA